MRISCRLASIFSLLPLTACTTFDGAPTPVLPISAMSTMVARLPMDSALLAFYSSSDGTRGGLTRRDYRDYVAGIYMAAADANYRDFRNTLGSGMRNSALGFDALSLLLTSAASMSTGNRAQDLAVAATGVTGLRTSVDRNLFFDRTVPAILTAMDAERAEARAAMIERLRLDERAYSLPQFFADIQNYELAATVDRAIARVGTASAEQLEAANARLDQAIAACDLDENVAPQIAALRVALRNDDPAVQSANYQIAAEVLDIDVADGTADAAVWRAIAIKLERDFCTRGERAAAMERVRQALTQ